MSVYGHAVPQGSMIAIPNKHTGRPMLKASNEKALRRWRKAVTVQARTVAPRVPLQGPTRVTATFCFTRAPSTLRRDGSPKDGEPDYPIKKNIGDIDKLTRALLDSLTDAGWWDDDAQVVELRIRKVWAPQPGVHFSVSEVK